MRLVFAAFAAIIGGAVGLTFQARYRRLESQVQEMAPEALFTRAIGLVLGLLIAKLMLPPIFLLLIPPDFSLIKPLVAFVGSIMLAYTGMNLADTHGRLLLRLINHNTMETMVAEGTLRPGNTRVLDTSSIIDGRIKALFRYWFSRGANYFTAIYSTRATTGCRCK